MLHVTTGVRDQILAHALSQFPHEACGMFSVLNGSDLVDVFHPMANAAGSPTRFELDGREMLELERDVDATGRAILGVMHSHTRTSPYPSATDVADVSRFDPLGSFHHVIASLRHAEPIMRSFRILDGTVTEEPISVVGTEPVLQDGAGAVAAVSRLPPRPT